MKDFSFSRLSLLWKILLSTSVAITLLFAITGWIVEKNALDTTARSLEEEVQASFQAYRSLWQSRLSRLASVSLILSQMSDVRKAFGTGDQATIHDTAGELWSKVSLDSDETLRFDANKGVAGEVVRSGEIIRVDEVAKDRRFFAGVPHRSLSHVWWHTVRGPLLHGARPHRTEVRHRDRAPARDVFGLCSTAGARLVALFHLVAF